MRFSATHIQPGGRSFAFRIGRADQAHDPDGEGPK
jgi:hypothetical protein